MVHSFGFSLPFYELDCKGVGDGCWIGSGPCGRSGRRGVQFSTL